MHLPSRLLLLLSLEDFSALPLRSLSSFRLERKLSAAATASGGGGSCCAWVLTWKSILSSSYHLSE